MPQSPSEKPVAKVLLAPRAVPAANRKLDDELVNSVLARHPNLTREQAIRYLLEMGA